MSRLPSASVPAGGAGSRPMVAIVGRPNVGKSTLFNRLAGKRLAIVEDVPGVTRDRHYADANSFGRDYVLIDTGGFDPGSDDPMKNGIATQIGHALKECELVICVFDATCDPMEADYLAVQLLREAGKPIIYVANKAESPKKQHEAATLYELGVDNLFLISALHGRGMGDFEEAIADALPEPVPFEPIGEDATRVAIVGRPNAGKSSLINRIIGEDRQLVDSKPGTTVDAVDTLVTRRGHTWVLIDTAGIRRKRSVRKTGESVETISVYHSIRGMQRADVVVLMIDAHDGVGEQDAKIAGLAVDRGRALVIALNKTDLMSPDEIKEAKKRTKEILAFAPWAPIVTVSAKTGRSVQKLMDLARAGMIAHRKRIATAEMNRFFEQVLDKHPPPTMNSKTVRLYYISQVMTAPPTFAIVTNLPDLVHFSYQRYVINQIRSRFGFEGTPVRVRYRDKRKKKLAPKRR